MQNSLQNKTTEKRINLIVDQMKKSAMKIMNSYIYAGKDSLKEPVKIDEKDFKIIIELDGMVFTALLMDSDGSIKIKEVIDKRNINKSISTISRKFLACMIVKNKNTIYL
jgi:hypothetical protein